MADTVQTRLKTSGMHCRSCVMLIQMNLSELPGVEKVEVDLEKGLTVVEHDPSVTDGKTLIDEIRRTGYEAEAVGGTA